MSKSANFMPAVMTPGSSSQSDTHVASRFHVAKMQIFMVQRSTVKLPILNRLSGRTMHLPILSLCRCDVGRFLREEEP